MARGDYVIPCMSLNPKRPLSRSLDYDSCGDYVIPCKSETARSTLALAVSSACPSATRGFGPRASSALLASWQTDGPQTLSPSPCTSTTIFPCCPLSAR